MYRYCLVRVGGSLVPRCWNEARMGTVLDSSDYKYKHFDVECRMLNACTLVGSQWSYSSDQASSPLPQSLPPEHCPGEED